MASSLEKGNGLNLKELADLSGVEFEIAKILMADVLKENTIVEKDGRYFTGDSITEETLTGPKKNMLNEVMKHGGDGIELDRVKDETMKKDIRDMIRLGFLVSLDGNIIYHHRVYAEMKNKILALFDDRDKISVPEAKDAAGLSRKYIIPLLNRIESDGLIRRLGDFRVKV